MRHDLSQLVYICMCVCAGACVWGIVRHSSSSNVTHHAQNFCTYTKTPSKRFIIIDCCHLNNIHISIQASRRQHTKKVYCFQSLHSFKDGKTEPKIRDKKTDTNRICWSDGAGLWKKFPFTWMAFSLWNKYQTKKAVSFLFWLAQNARAQLGTLKSIELISYVFTNYLHIHVRELKLQLRLRLSSPFVSSPHSRDLSSKKTSSSRYSCKSTAGEK